MSWNDENEIKWHKLRDLWEREREREREREHSVSETRWWPCNGRSGMKSEELKVELTWHEQLNWWLKVEKVCLTKLESRVKKNSLLSVYILVGSSFLASNPLNCQSTQNFRFLNCTNLHLTQLAIQNCLLGFGLGGSD